MFLVTVLGVKHLLLRLYELDAQAGDGLRVISFFDALLQTSADLDRVLMEAGRLAECPVGVVVPRLGPHRRVSAGDPVPAGPAPPYASTHGLAGGGEVWIERRGRAYPIDAMLLERFALARAAVVGTMAPAPSLGDPALVELGFPLHTAEGRGRLTFALALRRLATPGPGASAGGSEG